jgi:hypothetical protein
MGECQQFCVRGRFDHHAVKSLSSKMMTNRVVAVKLSGASVKELRRARRGMVRHLRGLFERAAVLQVSKRSHNRRFCGYTSSTRMPIEMRQRE